MLSCLIVSSKGQTSVLVKIKTSNMQQAFYNFGSLCKTLLAKKQPVKNALFSLVEIVSFPKKQMVVTRLQTTNQIANSKITLL